MIQLMSGNLRFDAFFAQEGGQKFGHGAENRIISEHTHNKYILLGLMEIEQKLSEIGWTGGHWPTLCPSLTLVNK